MSSRERDALDCIEIPIPCKASWDAMFGDDRVRHCGDCRQNVYNIAAFTRAEATRLLQARSGRVCLRIFRRPDGTVITDDCRARLRAARKRGLLIFAGTLLIVAWAQLCAQAVGLMGLRRLMSRDAAKPAPVAAKVAPAPEPPRPPSIEVMGPPPMPTMGLPDKEPRRYDPRPKHKRRADSHSKRASMGKPVAPHALEEMGDVVDLLKL